MNQIITINPATDTKIAAYPKMSEAEAKDHLKACHAAFLDWRKKTVEDRAPYLNDIAAKLREHKEELAELMTRETGKLYKDGLTEVDLCAALFEYAPRTDPLNWPTRNVPMRAARNAASSAISPSA